MKMLVLTALISIVTLGSSFAGNPNDPTNDKSNATTLKEAAAFHRHNIAVLHNQYGLAETRIKTSRGNHAELNREHKFFVDLYQQDIDSGIRVEQSKKAIAEINARYTKLRAERDAYEAKEIAKLQKHLEIAVKKEEEKFIKAQKALSKTASTTR
ncbi:hypothetical protein ACFOET_16890 [Parapedobacter deserti]|uniref:Uncharacterized protein n=1 Tax=Parapedobacter deserti TaxID=1912957 RepID=A0ABV7JRA0_9SPHI